MANLDEKVSLAAEQILKRPLNDDERYEIYRLADVLGMKDVQVRPDRSLLIVV